MTRTIIAGFAALALVGCAGHGRRGSAQHKCSIVGGRDQRYPVVVVMAMVDVLFCPRVPRLMLAIYDDFVLFRRGPVCATEDQPILKHTISAGERGELLQDIDVNPLLFQAESPVEFCPRCVGRELDLIAIGKRGSSFRIAVAGAESGSAVVLASTHPTESEFNAYIKQCRITEIRGTPFDVGLRIIFPGEVELGSPFDTDLGGYCRGNR